MPTPEEILREYWGFSTFKPAQKEIITHLIEGNDALALLPTGGGKSICFQVPALMQEGICIVVSPLIALMQDQVQNLNAKGIKSLMLKGGISLQELDTTLDNCIYGNYKFLYLSPERLQQDLVQERISKMNVNLIAIDEAHCISEWGHDFRPAYRKTNILKELHPEIPVVALTATATKRVQSDILETLGIDVSQVFKYSFKRNNIQFLIQKEEDKTHHLIGFLKKHPGSSIIYVRNRKATLELKEVLLQHQISADAYHGGLETSQKNKLLEGWLKERFKVMIATTAFGMGIDKENVQNVIHFHLPESLESFFQEAGRAGRNGEDATSLLLYNDHDFLLLNNQFLKNIATVKSVKLVYKKLNAYFSIAYGEGEQTEHNFNFSDFCKNYQLPFALTYNSLELLDRVGVIKLTKEFSKKTALQFLISSKQVFYFLERNPSYEELLKTLFRLKGGFFEHKTSFSIDRLCERSGLTSEIIESKLEYLSKEKIIDLSIANQDTSLVFLVPREDDIAINPFSKYIKQQYSLKEEKIKAVTLFVSSKERCKVKELLAYFGEDEKEDCGKCSVCLNRKKKHTRKVYNDVYQQILVILEKEEMPLKQLVPKIEAKEEDTLYLLRAMLDKKLISISSNNIIQLKK
ncbi:RecQ family ATP-dependent DNA helicase [Mesonia sp.]|uniref:RecQ family ATP-dependent DNA helicase n=1 Tax=Mesonia sp. TaxID=1960830 RepID=UPI003F94DA4E